MNSAIIRVRAMSPCRLPVGVTATKFQGLDAREHAGMPAIAMTIAFALANGTNRHMNKSIDFRSAAIGFAIAVLLCVGVAAATNSTRQVGKYQIAIAGGPGNTVAVIVDTATGQAWEHSTSGNARNGKQFFGPKIED